MKLINANNVYYDNDFEKWYFANDEDFENAQVVDDNYVKENKELKQQLAEKDKEIKELLEKEFETFRDMKDYKNLWLSEQRKNKEIRKQVCDEIKDKLQTHCDYDENLGWYLTKEKIDLLIGQIEKGE